MRRRRLAACALAAACAADPQEDASDGSSSAPATTSSDSSGSSSTTSTATSDPSGSSSGGSTSAADSTDASSTGAPAGCDFEQIVCETADASKSVPIDCGTVDLDDDLAAWQAARTCFTDAVLDQQGVKLIWQNQAIDSTNFSAMVAQVGVAYALSRFDYDDYQGDVQGSVRSCTGISMPGGCTVAVGLMCLDCIDPGEPSPICE